MSTAALDRAPIVLPDLDRPSALFEHITPNWFASVMGTGIVANAAASLPARVPGLHVFATVVWIAVSAALVLLTAAFAVHWARHRTHALSHARHPVMVQFYGAPPMALLTVGAGTMLLGGNLLGATAATTIFVVLWTVGTVLGLLTSVLVPYSMITAHDHRSGHTAVALPAWLMPVVPPMVSASTGALLIPHVPEGQWRLTLLAGCYAMFGLSLLIGTITMTLVYGRLVVGGAPPVQAAPTIWITLGMIGQSITAANLLGKDAAGVLSDSVATGLHVFGIVYGLVMGGFGVLMFTLATLLTVHAARHGLSFSLTWWSFTFPVGTCVTGASALGAALGSTAIDALAVGLYAVLTAAWATVATHTVRGSVRGSIFRAT